MNINVFLNLKKMSRTYSRNCYDCPSKPIVYFNMDFKSIHLEIIVKVSVLEWERKVTLNSWQSQTMKCQGGKCLRLPGRTAMAMLSLCV